MGKNSRHKRYLRAWEDAMRFGLLGGRPFSETTISVYKYYANWYFKRYDTISIQNLKKALLSIPPVHYVKRAKIYQVIICFSKVLIEEQLLSEEFIRKAKPFRPKKHRPEKRISVTEAEINKILAVCQTPLEHLIVTLLSQTGLRVTEAALLCLSDVDLEKRILTVKLAKWGKSRRVGISNTLVKAFQAYLQVRPDNDSDRLFFNRFGKPMDRFSIRIRLNRLGNNAGVHVTPHALRRAFVTINANKGRPLPMLQIACGHSTIATTRSYCMTSEDETIEAMQGWN